MFQASTETTLGWTQTQTSNLTFGKRRGYGFCLQSCHLYDNRVNNRVNRSDFVFLFQENWEKNNAKKIKAAKKESKEKIDELSKKLKEALDRLQEVEKKQDDSGNQVKMFNQRKERIT